MKEIVFNNWREVYQYRLIEEELVDQAIDFHLPQICGDYIAVPLGKHRIAGSLDFSVFDCIEIAWHEIIGKKGFENLRIEEKWYNVNQTQLLNIDLIWGADFSFDGNHEIIGQKLGYKESVIEDFKKVVAGELKYIHNF